MKAMIGQRMVAVILVILACCVGNSLGKEREFPVKPINLYLGYPPGGALVYSATIICEGMKKYLNQPVIVNSKPGAAQAIAAEFVKNSNPDGYTLFYGSHAELISKVAKEGPMLKFRLEDLDSLGAAPYSPYTLTVNVESLWKTIEDLIAASRKSPGALVNGSSGAGTPTHMLGELFSRKAGIALNHIPFIGAGPANTALLGGHVHIGFMSVATYGALINPGGGLRTLAVFDRKRNPSLPDVPTAMERGYDIVLASWFGLQGPKGLPKEVRETLTQGFERTAKDPKVISALERIGFNITYRSPEEQDKKIQEEYKLYLDIWEKAGFIKK